MRHNRSGFEPRSKRKELNFLKFQRISAHFLQNFSTFQRISAHYYVTFLRTIFWKLSAFQRISYIFFGNFLDPGSLISFEVCIHIMLIVCQFNSHYLYQSAWLMCMALNRLPFRCAWWWTSCPRSTKAVWASASRVWTSLNTPIVGFSGLLAIFNRLQIIIYGTKFNLGAECLKSSTTIVHKWLLN